MHMIFIILLNTLICMSIYEVEMINMFIVVYKAGGLYYLIKIVIVIVIVMITAGVWDVLDKKVQVGKDQEKAQSEKDSHSKNRGGKKTKLTIRHLHHIVSRMSSYFLNRWPLSYLNLTKTMKIHIRHQQHKKFFKHQDIKQKEPPQKYRLGTISNRKLLAGLNRFYRSLTSPSASAVVHNI